MRKVAGKESTKRRTSNERAPRRRGSLTDDGHPLPVAVEVEESEHLVRDLVSHLADGDGVLCAWQEYEAKTASRCDQSTFIGRRGLIHQFTWDGTPVIIKMIACLSRSQWFQLALSCTSNNRLRNVTRREDVTKEHTEEHASLQKSKNFLTVLLLYHDSVAEWEQLEELQHVRVAFRADEGNKVTVGELELSVGVLVPAEVNRLHRRDLNKHEPPKWH